MCTFPMIVQLRGTSQGIWREILGSIFGKYKLSAKMMGLRASVAETDVVVVSGNGIVNGVLRGNGVDVRMVHPHPSPLPSRERGLIGVLCFSLGSRLRGNDGVSAPFTLTPALSHRGRGGLSGVLCFSLGSRLRGKDGSCAKHPRWERARACPGLEPGVRVDNGATYAQCPFRRAKGARAKRAGYARGRGGGVCHAEAASVMLSAVEASPGEIPRLRCASLGMTVRCRSE